MAASNVGFSSGTARSLVAIAGACLALATVSACGSHGSNNSGWDGGGTFAPSSGGAGHDAGIDASFSPGNGTPPTGDGSVPIIGCLTCPDATMDAGVEAAPPPPPPPMAIGSLVGPDCAGCTFPGANAMPCPASAPAINIVYPNDTVLLPPNLNVISVHFTPFGAPFSKFSVDFSNTPNTDWHIITACKNQTIDMQSGMPSGGCEVVVDPVSWSKLVGANRGGGPVTITVRGTTDGTCATASKNQINISFAEQDLLGTYYYWKSQLSMNGVGGQIWKKTFGDLTNPEVIVTPPIPGAMTGVPCTGAWPQGSICATCNGCHSLSRDGTRMVVYSDDDDSDDEYDDIAGNYLDMTQTPPKPYPGGIVFPGWTGGGQPPGFSTVDPTVTTATSAANPGYYLTSNGYPCPGAGGFNAAPRGCGRTSSGYPIVIPPNAWSLWNGTNGAFVGSAIIGPAGTRPTMPDWSPDGNVLVYVVPAGGFLYPNGLAAGAWRTDDDHIYGGSLYTVPYSGMGTFGTPSLLLQSNGENNYYPSYSPDVPMSFVLFNRADAQMTNGMCAGGFCPDDSFSNPRARLMLLSAPPSGGGDGGATPMPDGGAPATPIDLEKANGSPITAKVPLSNSYPKWAPFVQTYHGNKLFWFTFSSTRDYGVRVINQNNSPVSPTLKKSGLYQCYPSDTAETFPNRGHGVPFSPLCQEPQLWMAPLTFSEAQKGRDPSGVAFWIPYQQIDTHNHTAQWTQQHVPPPPPPPDAGIPVCSCQMNVYQPCGAANGGCDCCTGTGLVCTGSNTCFAPPH